MSDLFVNMARRILQDRAASRDKLELAGWILMEACKWESKVVGKSEVTLADMLGCLDHGGIVAAYGARCLYVRTGRDGLYWGPAESNGLPFIVDRANWEAYLRDHNPANAL